MRQQSSIVQVNLTRAGSYSLCFVKSHPLFLSELGYLVTSEILVFLSQILSFRKCSLVSGAVVHVTFMFAKLFIEMYMYICFEGLREDWLSQLSYPHKIKKLFTYFTYVGFTSCWLKRQ